VDNPVNSSFESRYRDFCQKAVEAERAGNLEEAEQQYCMAWDAIPEPKYSHKEAQIHSASMIEFFLQTNQPAKTEVWLERMEPAYGKDDTYFQRLRPYVLFELGEVAEAFEIFHALSKNVASGCFVQVTRNMLNSTRPRYKSGPGKKVVYYPAYCQTFVSKKCFQSDSMNSIGIARFNLSTCRLINRKIQAIILLSWHPCQHASKD
jgi:hypothetical protein